MKLINYCLKYLNNNMRYSLIDILIGIFYLMPLNVSLSFGNKIKSR